MKPPKILIVDDNFDSRLVIKSALRSKKYEMIEAQNGEEGIRLALQTQPDLVIMDIMMPGINGYEALDQLKVHPLTAHIPVLIVTALGSMEEQIIALEKGAEGLFGKPFDRRALVERIEAIVGSSLLPTERMTPQNQELLRYYYTDALTGLSHRSQLIKDIKSGAYSALILMDIDRFKDIVYFYGHQISDNCLKQFGAKISAVFSDNNFKNYRISGDVFAVMIKTCEDEETLHFYINQLNETLNRGAFHCEAQEIQIRITIGASCAQKELLVTAEKALSAAKSSNMTALVFDPAQEQFHSFDKNIYWVQKITEAIEQDRIVPFFQPIIDTQNGVICKYECLVRIIDTSGTVYTPLEFLEISKKSRSYAAITKCMIAKSFEVFKTNACSFSINLSARDMTNRDISDYIFSEIERFGEGERVIFELLESEGIENYDAVYAFIKKAQSYGCKIAIDDFGSGYSNFIHLLRLNVDIIKIDGSLIRDLDSDQNACMMVQTIIEFCKKLDILTVAEFVHSESIYEIVKALGIDYAQGYYLGQPKENLIV